MKWFDSIRKKLGYNRRRKMYFAMEARWSPATEENFYRIKVALHNLLVAYVEERIEYPNCGICINAGFLGFAEPYRAECSLFCDMLGVFNREVRGVKKFAKYWPFSDVDGEGWLESDHWSGKAGDVRLEAIHWVMDQIEEYKLDGGCVYPDHDD